MSVQCAQCGEELLGAVNRCWRCGTLVPSRPGNVAEPPVRRAPIRPAEDRPSAGGDDEVVVAAFADQHQAARPCPAAENGPATNNRPVDAGAGCNSGSFPVRRVGSPFASAGTAVATEAAARSSQRDGAARQANLQVAGWRPPAATSAGALAALVLGVLSLGASFYTTLCLVPAVLGLGLGVWGLGSARRGVATLGILLCCLALLCGGFFASVDWYETRFGHKPWEAATEEEEELPAFGN